MAEPYQIRSDFADEIISADIQSKTYEHIEKKNDYIRSNYIKVLCDENELGKHLSLIHIYLLPTCTWAERFLRWLY